MIRDDLLYHKEHEWVRVDGTRAAIGISHFAQEALGDIVYLELPKVGARVQYGDEVTEIESTKTTSMLYAPVGGEIVSVNQSLEEHPERINEDVYGEGWVLVVEMTDPTEVDKLMSAKEYASFLENE
ncbi:MAG: glycine cleavage system protein GcvH [Nitrospiria bacterium]